MCGQGIFQNRLEDSVFHRSLWKIGSSSALEKTFIILSQVREKPTRPFSLLTSITSQTSPKPASVSMTCCMNSQNPLKAVILEVRTYCDERIQLNISRKKRCMWQSLGKFQALSFRCPFPVELWTALFSQQLCVTVLAEDCQTREGPLSLGVQSFLKFCYLSIIG